MEANLLHRSLAHSPRTLAGISRCSTTAKKSTSAPSAKSPENFNKKRSRTWPRMPSSTNPKMPKNQRTHKKNETFDSTQKHKKEKKRSYVNFACNFSRMPP